MGCPVNDAPKKMPVMQDMAMRILARHCRANINDMMRRIKKYQLAWIQIDSAVIAVNIVKFIY